MQDDMLALQDKATITYNGQSKPLSNIAMELAIEASNLADTLQQLEWLEDGSLEDKHAATGTLLGVNDKAPMHLMKR